MPYITEAYYKDTYYGLDAGTDFNRLASRASDDIDLACLGSIVLANLNAAQLALVQKATAAQVEWYVQNGDTYNDDGKVGGFSIGSYSEQTNLTQNQKPAALCPRARAYLEQSGLMSRCAAIIGPAGRRLDE